MTYIGFLGVIWFTWLQVMMFDIRFARDSLFERICKAMQLGIMVGFASAGTRITTRVRPENVWAFQSLSLMLGGSRLLLSVQYIVSTVLIRKRMSCASKGLYFIAAALLVSSLVHFGVSQTLPLKRRSTIPANNLEDVFCLRRRLGSFLRLDCLVCTVLG